MVANGYDKADLQEVLTALKDGIQLHPKQNPRLVWLPNTPAVLRNLSLCKERIAYYQDIGAVENIASRPSIIHPLHVVEKPGKKPRMVLDLSRNFNELIDHDSFHMKSVRDAVNISYPGCFYGKMDVSDCFLSFPIHPDSRQFLAFELDGQCSQFKRLPFGLCSAPLWTDRFMRCIDFALQQAGLRHVRFCDDFLFVASSPEQLRKDMELALRVLEQHGLIVNPDKTEGPSQSITFLGVGIDSVEQVLFLPQEKVTDLRQAASDMASRSSTKLKHLQSLVGKFSFAASVLPGARPFFRKLIDASRGKNKFVSIPVTQDMQRDLQSWSILLKTWNRRERWTRQGLFVLEHDASGHGFGFLLTAVPQGFNSDSLPSYQRPGNAFAGQFSTQHEEQTRRSIQWGELLAIAVSVAIYAPFLKDSSVLLKTDNIADVFIIRRQSTSNAELLTLLRCICATCVRHNIHIEVEHVPGHLNSIPDYLSRPDKHKCCSNFTVNGSSFKTHFIHSSSFQPGTEALLPATFCWTPSLT